MSEKLQFFSIIFLGGCILLSSWLISQSLHSNQEEKVGITQEQSLKYELIPVNDNNIIIFDKESGELWRKFIASNEGPTDWTMENPFE
ncbi:hypothetical protein [Chengkuizengella sediminis]|uniref:hypothetical protein n=1 Tax=Chengkuizengella sediminis TaxID=1885917 RepID=UPI00196B87B9|nr:hypothetical protein [Chengkuizengella sediminis]